MLSILQQRHKNPFLELMYGLVSIVGSVNIQVHGLYSYDAVEVCVGDNMIHFHPLSVGTPCLAPHCYISLDTPVMKS
jgi:hypothetical protein